ncbi:unnamed protein product (macronuclear) [Paramecium tetraurelia]|uniref:Ubiquitin-like domain-containing protein n=1 Tax=Paramecium tetraurelia TaxID=5888 RepID=A0DJF3_PARTE|nr:uncharacterized protein GSPATT00017514001 [Paramecium tetraurelia]CAK83170.1 unnamed protein product [Paramecium tetraurelia]|eukprot:XP_001450567.1 hypothetical protein (macronuclear) [Paramecium tetraurelia strain d4-2]
MKSCQIEEEDMHPTTQPGFITVVVKVSCNIFTNVTSIKIDPQIPFNLFCNLVKEMIFSSIDQKQADTNFEYIKQNQVIEEKEIKSLLELGFTNQDVLEIKFKLRGG